MSPTKNTEAIEVLDHKSIDFDDYEDKYIEDGGIIPTRPPMPQLVLITPALATLFLDANAENRHLRVVKADAFARDMNAGAWDPRVGDPVHFNENTGHIGNGQHRLRAVELSGKAQWFYVLYVPKSTIRKVDRGTTRNIKDTLALEGYGRFSPIMVSVARRIVTMNAGYSPVATGRYTPSDEEVYQVISEQRSVLEKAAEIGVKIGRRWPVRPGIAAIAYYVTSKIDQGSADEFFDTQLGDGVGLEFDSPANALTRRLTNYNNYTGQDMTLPMQWNHIIKAWNHYRRGEKISKLQEPRNGWGAAGYALPL